MKYFKKLIGKSIYLSPINPDDYPIYTKWINDTSIGINFGQAARVIGLISEKEKLIELSSSGTNLAIVKLKDDKLIGNCSLFSINSINRTADLGIFIGETDDRGKGYGTEACQLLVEYGIKILNLKNIMLRVFSHNTAGIKAYKKAGFSEFGRRTGSQYLNGKYFDEIFMEITDQNMETNLLSEILP